MTSINEKFGFIITRHVTSEKINNYWNQNVKLIRMFYPVAKIVIIDDNSDQSFVKADFDYSNIIVINSEYPKRGELLPFVYYFRNKWFENAIIIHDSVFIHKRMRFENYKLPVIPLWDFPEIHNLELDNTTRIVHHLRNNIKIMDLLYSNETHNYGLNNKTNWIGAFGCQCYINHDFLKHIYEKYNIENLINVVNCRMDRCSLERIFGIIFYINAPYLKKIHSIYGSIFLNQNWGYTYDQYIEDFKNKRIKKPIIKVWTGR